MVHHRHSLQLMQRIPHVPAVPAGLRAQGGPGEWPRQATAASIPAGGRVRLPRRTLVRDAIPPGRGSVAAYWSPPKYGWQCIQDGVGIPCTRRAPRSPRLCADPVPPVHPPCNRERRVAAGGRASRARVAPRASCSGVYPAHGGPRCLVWRHAVGSATVILCSGRR
jgi:hypothetical protein